MRPFNRQHHFTKTSVFCFSLVELVKGRQSINLLDNNGPNNHTHKKKYRGNGILSMACRPLCILEFLKWDFYCTVIIKIQ